MKIKVIDQLFIRHNERKEAKPSIWFIHGFGDSGLAYQEVFNAPIQNDFNVYVVDMPGFGMSPLNTSNPTMQVQAELLSKVIRKETIDQGKVNIVAHSLGALIGTWVCKILGNKINYFISVEGNLTEADSYFSSLPLQFTTAAKFKESFEIEIFEIAKNQERFKRYFSSIKFANAEGMRNWSISSQDHIKENKAGFEFLALSCKKIYFWGDVDTPLATQDFIIKHQIPNRLFSGVGHWHMFENEIIFYHTLHEILHASEASLNFT